jgi:hypothetical protein
MNIPAEPDMYGLYLTTHVLTDIYAPGVIRTRNPSNRAAADRRLRPRDHWDRRIALVL